MAAPGTPSGKRRPAPGKNAASVNTGATANNSVTANINADRGVKRINLALQGGGSHGAFTWGVLDRLLEDPRIDIEGISGASAGAINAAVVAYGLATGGREGGRRALAEFWQAVSQAHAFSPFQQSPLDRINSRGDIDMSLAYQAFDAMSRMLSPYQLNPANLNPLRDLLLQHVDFDRLRAAGRNGGVKLFASATNVLTGKIALFRCSDTTVDTVLASACLPQLFQAVEVQGEFYWDGGFMGNPPVWPLIYECESRDILLVMVNPIEITEVPNTPQEIQSRLNEITFNAGLMREMRAIHFVTRLIDNGFDDEGRLKRLFLHGVAAEAEMRDLGASSKLNAGWEFISWLRELGRTHAQAFLEQHFDDIGKRSTLDIDSTFL